MNTKELFDFVTDPTLQDKDVDLYLNKMQERITERERGERGGGGGERGEEEREEEREEREKREVDDLVFRGAHIPRTLNEVVHFERDAERAQEGNKDGFILYFFFFLFLSNCSYLFYCFCFIVIFFPFLSFSLSFLSLTYKY